MKQHREVSVTRFALHHYEVGQGLQCAPLAGKELCQCIVCFSFFGVQLYPQCGRLQRFLFALQELRQMRGVFTDAAIAQLTSLTNILL